MFELLFDLDGTLTDPAVGITSCIQHALVRLGRPAPPAASLRRFIGPPLRATFAELLDDEGPIADEALAYYRDRFTAIGMFENGVYPDIVTGLSSLRAGGHRLWVVTSKPEVYARRIVDHFELKDFFHDVYGSGLDGQRADKAELIAHVLAHEHLDARRTWMIGDRGHDIDGGRATGVRTIGVAWGYGPLEELQLARPDFIASSMADLVGYLDRVER